MGCHQNKNAGIQTSIIKDDPTSVAITTSPQLSIRQGNSIITNGKLSKITLNVPLQDQYEEYLQT